MSSEVPDPHGCYFRLLLSDPLVAVARSGRELPYAIAHLARLAAGSTAHLFVSLTWHAPHDLRTIVEARDILAREHRNIHMVLMSATEADEAMFRAAGVDSIWCSHNSLVNERLFYPEPVEAKLYDAVYTARLSALKRHELAALVPRMAVITNDYGVEPETAHRYLAGYRDLAWHNYGKTSAEVIGPAEVRGILNRSFCGLALSALEGAMYASAEYLLCGLPVVSTPSQGGRDVFYHPDYVAIVEETPQAVADAVARFKGARPDPMMIRRRMLEMMRPHRARFLMRLSGIAQRNLFADADENLRTPMTAGHLGDWVGG